MDFTSRSEPYAGTLWMHSLSSVETEMDEAALSKPSLPCLSPLRESRCTWLLQRAFSASVCLSGLTMRVAEFIPSPSQSPRSCVWLCCSGKAGKS